jgi:mono/diheme cytochrome c family protein
MKGMSELPEMSAPRRPGGGAGQNSGAGPRGQWARRLAFCGMLALAGFAASGPEGPLRGGRVAQAEEAGGLAGDPASADPVVRGAYLFAAAGCVGCHTDVKNAGAGLAGGRALETPFGTFYSPNITPDPGTGIGAWTEADFRRAMREGVAPDGSAYFPVFPYPSFTGMTDADLADMWAYMRTIPPVVRENRSHDANFPFGWRALAPVWQWLNFEPGPFAPDSSWPEEVARGAYLVNAVAHCGECHTPRDALGALDRDAALSGTPDGPEGGTVPNITPDPATGIGGWSDDEVMRVLETGMLPNYDVVGGAMGEVVRNSTGLLKPEDRRAILAYLRTLPPIANPEARATQPEF